jgi:hypothetical protein
MKQCICGSERILQVTAKCSDMCSVSFANSFGDISASNGYVPSGIGLGNDSDYIEIDLCMECGKVQGKFPVTDAKVRKALQKP